MAECLGLGLQAFLEPLSCLFLPVHGPVQICNIVDAPLPLAEGQKARQSPASAAAPRSRCRSGMGKKMHAWRQRVGEMSHEERERR